MARRPATGAAWCAHPSDREVRRAGSNVQWEARAIARPGGPGGRHLGGRAAARLDPRAGAGGARARSSRSARSRERSFAFQAGTRFALWPPLCSLRARLPSAREARRGPPAARPHTRAHSRFHRTPECKVQPTATAGLLEYPPDHAHGCTCTSRRAPPTLASPRGAVARPRVADLAVHYSRPHCFRRSTRGLTRAPAQHCVRCRLALARAASLTPAAHS